jgi:hypothetical protein
MSDVPCCRFFNTRSGTLQFQEDAPEYTPYVHIDHGNLLAKGECSYSVCGVPTYARELDEVVDVSGKPAVVAAPQMLCERVEADGTIVIAEAAPGDHDVPLRCPRKGTKRGEEAQKLVVLLLDA